MTSFLNRSPSTSTSTLPQQTKSFFSSSSLSSRRQSFGSMSGGLSPQMPEGIGYSPTPPTSSPAGTGSPAFSKLRSLLPFGSNKNGHTISSPKSPFGSVRKSMARERERKSSLSNDALSPIIAIERSNGPVPDETAIRRSVSLSRLEKPLPREPVGEEYIGDALGTGLPKLRTPSPGPLLTQELSTILEADNSGLSKISPDELPKSTTPLIVVRDYLQPQKASSIPVTPRNRPKSNSNEPEADISALNLSASEVADQVRDALRRSTASSKSGEQWLTADKEVVIIDADEHPEVVNKTFNTDNIDPDLMALLTPNSTTKNSSPSSVHPQPESKQPSPSHSTANFSSSPAGSRSRQSSSSLLPRLRSTHSTSSSPTSPRFLIGTTPSPTTTNFSTTTTTQRPSAKQPTIAVNGSDYSPSSAPASPSSNIPSVSTSTPITNRRLLNSPQAPGVLRAPVPRNGRSLSTLTRSGSGDNNTFSGQETSNSPNAATRIFRQVMLGATGRSKENTTGGDESPSPSSIPLSRGSLDSRRPSATLPSYVNEIGLGRPSLEIRRPVPPLESSRIRPPLSRSPASTSPSHTSRAMSEADSSPLRGFHHEDDISKSPLESNRGRDLIRTPSLKVPHSAGERPSPIPRGSPSNRIRKRSMSVQERIAKGRLGHMIGGSDVDNAVVGASVSRPSSSLSVLGTHGSRGVDNEPSDRGRGRESPVGSGPKLEWLGPRTAKAFKAAGLLDFERDKGRDGQELSGRLRYRSGSVSNVASPSPLSAGAISNRFGSMRSASDYNPGHARAQSRMAFSESGANAGGVHGRRGSGSYSAYNGGGSHTGSSQYGYNGQMESPTFTVSTSSRGDRDTPRSTSTAPTSLSESFGYPAREREHEREELRELKDKHGTEMAALLGALSDCQRTVRILREENTQLRERLDYAAALARDNENLRQAYDSVERECSSLRRELAALRAIKAPGMTPSWSGSSGSSTLRSTMPKGSPLANDSTPTFTQSHREEEEEVYNDTVIVHNSMVHDLDDDDELTGRPSDDIFPPSSSTPVKRRHSNTSSIFPLPPSNMTMLLHDDPASQFMNLKNDYDQSQFPFTFPSPHPNASKSQSQPITYRSGSNSGHALNKSINSTTSISPTTATFSMVTGSPVSLRLRPEHELLLGDMEPLDLGVRSAGSEGSNRGCSEEAW